MKYASLSEEDGVRAVEIYRERFAPIGKFENKVYDGVVPMLKKLKESGKTIAVATSKPHLFANQISEKFELSPYIDALFGSELDGRNTDKALVIKEAMASLGAKESETVMIGDRVHDAIGAEKNNIPFIGVKYGYAKEGELEKSNAIKIAASPEELSGILLSL